MAENCDSNSEKKCFFQRFLDLFTQLKNVDFRDSLGLEELKNFHIDQRKTPWKM